MNLNKTLFYNSIREDLFKGHLSFHQVDGMDAVINEWDKRGLTDLRWLAYMFATIFHETDTTMKPIEEYGKGKGRKYGKVDGETGQIYYGRGFVQLTWRKNYDNMGALIGVDLVHHPELALNLEIATKILFEGMLRADSHFGDFTGKCLEDFFNDKVDDPVSARRIINGYDRATLIAGYYKEFYKALNGN